MTDLPHLAGRLLDAPLLVHRAKLETILGVMLPRLRGEALRPAMVTPARSYELCDGIAILPILGTLVRRTVGLEVQSGLTSYADIQHLLSQAIQDPAVKAILLDIDSAGGEAGGVFDLAEAIYSARQIKPVWAVANEEAFSAAYALASAAERVFLPRTGGVGSIGVIAVHLDQSRAEAEAGLSYTAIYAGARKNDASRHEPLSDPARAVLQGEVDRIYDLFVESVARQRKLSFEAVRATEAGLFFGEQALKAGMADDLGTFEDAFAALKSSLSLSPNPNRKELLMSTPETIPDPQPDPAAALAQARAEAKAETLAYVAEVTELCQLAGQPDKAASFISKAVAVTDVRHALLEAKAREAEATAIASQSPVALLQISTPKIDTNAIYAARNAKQGGAA